MGILNEFAIQLYSVRHETKADFIGTLKKIASLGYTGVEFAGYGDLSSKDMKKVLNDLNLEPVGSHVGLERLDAAFDEEVEYHQILGTKYIICPWASMKNEDEAKVIAEKLNIYADKLKNTGIKFGYHNHSQEFEITADGKYLLDVIIENTPQAVLMELDMYWVSFAGVDAITYMEKIKDRLKLLHLKQIKDMESKKCVDLPDGMLDYNGIIQKGLELGVKEFILEQEEFEVSSEQSLKRNIEYIKNLK